MKIGDYVRTKRGSIARILKFNSTGSITCDRNIYWGVGDYNSKKILCDLTQIIKSSPNIIDLIEVGDYVNGKKVVDKWEEPGWFGYFIKLEGEKTVPTIRKIKSIVTREQFESMEYKIESEVN